MNPLSEYYFKESESKEENDKDISSITTNADIAKYPSVVDRFFTKYYYRKSNTADEDHIILFHSNRICLVGLAPSHIALQKGISGINFNIGNIDRSQNKVTGKGKKGAMLIQPTSALAIVTCTDGTQYKILSCVTGKLIEINHNLETNPHLLSEIGDGYVAVCLPKLENCDKIKSELINEEQYNQMK